MSKMEVVYKDINENEITLTPEIVKAYLTSNPAVTNQEMGMFLKLCEMQRLNPFLREVYLVKYGTSPATFVTGKETFLKRAAHHPKYRGHKVRTEGEVPDMTSTAEVYVEGYAVPIEVTVHYNEYVGKKSDGSPNAMWNSKPKTMLNKVALVQALREAFPDTFGGMYSQEEINTVNADDLPTAPVQMSEKKPDIEVSEPPYAAAPEKETPAPKSEPEPEPPKEKGKNPMHKSVIGNIKGAFLLLNKKFDDAWFARILPDPQEGDRVKMADLYAGVKNQMIPLQGALEAKSLDDALMLRK